MTNMGQSVTNMNKRPQYFVAIIRHQHRCSQIINQNEKAGIKSLNERVLHCNGSRKPYANSQTIL